MAYLQFCETGVPLRIIKSTHHIIIPPGAVNSEEFFTVTFNIAKPWWVIVWCFERWMHRALLKLDYLS